MPKDKSHQVTIAIDRMRDPYGAHDQQICAAMGIGLAVSPCFVANAVVPPAPPSGLTGQPIGLLLALTYAS